MEIQNTLAAVILVMALFFTGCREEPSGGSIFFEPTYGTDDARDDDGATTSGVDACLDYLEAVEDCFQEAALDPSAITDQMSCEDQLDSAAEHFTCLTNVFIDADCSSATTVAGIDVSSCSES